MSRGAIAALVLFGLIVVGTIFDFGWLTVISFLLFVGCAISLALRHLMHGQLEWFDRVHGKDRR